MEQESQADRRKAPAGDLASSRSPKIDFFEGFSGPLPPPDIFQKYDEIVPGAAERLLKMVEGETSHRRALENMGATALISERKRGQYFGLAIGSLGLLTSLVMAYIGAYISSTVVGGATVVGLVAVFVVGKKFEQG